MESGSSCGVFGEHVGHVRPQLRLALLGLPDDVQTRRQRLPRPASRRSTTLRPEEDVATSLSKT